MRYFLLIFLLIVGLGTLTAQDDAVTPEMLADENGQFILVDDLETYYIAEGDPANPAIVLLHGFNGSNFVWRNNIPKLVEAGFYVIAPDWSPFGLSAKPTYIDYSFRAIAGRVVGLMDALEVETAHIVGHSIGGWITAYIAGEHTERVESAVFVAGGLFDLEVEGLMNFSFGDPDSPLSFLGNLDPDAPESQMLIRGIFNPGTFGDSLVGGYADESFLTEEIIAGYARPLLLEEWAGGFLAYSIAQNPDPITLEQLVAATEELPVLFMWGEEDTTVPVGLGELMHEAMPNSEFISYPELKHSFLSEAAEQFNADLIAFLNQE